MIYSIDFKFCTYFSLQLFVIFGNGGGGTVESFDGATRAVDFLRDSSSGNPVQFWGDPANAEATQACAALVR